MPVDRESNLGSLFIAVDDGEPFEIKDVVYHMEEPDEAPEEFITLDDLTKPMTFSIDVHPSSSSYKSIMRLIKRGNNWRRMHGLKPIRVPMKERRKKNG